jgi:flavodoxin
MKGSRMRKIFKAILVVLAVFIVLFAVFAALIFADLAAYTATSSKTLQYTGQFMGTALVLYDPGLSGASTKVAQQIADDLYNQSLTVTLAGIKSHAAANTTGYDIIVIGGPIYAGAPTASVKDALSNLKHNEDARVGVYGSGQGTSVPEDITAIRAAIPALQSDGALSKALVVKIGESEDLTQRAQDFVNDLIK